MTRMLASVLLVFAVGPIVGVGCSSSSATASDGAGSSSDGGRDGTSSAPLSAPGLLLDGVACTNVAETGARAAAPACGMQWATGVSATCSVGNVVISLYSSSPTYPQNCGPQTLACDASAGADTGFSLFINGNDSDGMTGDCTVTQGPTTTSFMPVSISATYTDLSTSAKHTFVYLQTP